MLSVIAGGRDVDRSAERAPVGLEFDRLAVGVITVANSPDGARNEPAEAVETAGDYLRKLAATVSGQIIRGGDAPLEASNGEAHKSAHPDTEFQAKASEDNGATGKATMRRADSMTGEASRSTSATNTGEADRGAGNMPTCAPTPRDVVPVGTHSPSRSLTSSQAAVKPEADTLLLSVSGAYSPWAVRRSSNSLRSTYP